MIRIALFLAGFGLLASCGVDGEPVPPQASATHDAGAMPAFASAALREGPSAQGAAL